MNRTKWSDSQTKNEIQQMTRDYDKFDDNGNIIRDTTDGTPVIIDRKVLNELSHSKQEFKIGNDIYKFREKDTAGLTGIEHIANVKHHLKVEDIPYIEKCLDKQELIYCDSKNPNNRSIYLSGKFGTNEDPYLKVVIKISNHTIITAYPTRRIKEPNKNKLSKI